MVKETWALVGKVKVMHSFGNMRDGFENEMIFKRQGKYGIGLMGLDGKDMMNSGSLQFLI